MEIVKRISIIAITFLILLTSAFYSYTRIDSRCLVYADSDDWTQVTTNEQLVEAFRYYCKSRDVTIDGSIANAVTQFTTKSFNGIVNFLGIDVTALQAHLKYRTDGNLGLRYLFDREGISAYNRIFAQFLQDNDLAVGDQVENKEVLSGLWWQDDGGDGCFCLIYNGYNSTITKQGTVYRNLDANYFSTLTTAGSISDHFIYNNVNYPYYIVTEVTNTYRRVSVNKINTYNSNIYILRTSGTNTNEGYVCAIYDTYFNKYYWGYVRNNGTTVEKLYELDNVVIQNGNVYITTNNTTINNNNYEGDTIINNNGDTNYYPDNPDTPDNPDPWQPTYPNEPTGDPDDWGVELPNLDIPWFLQGKEDKFPWDIPFNIILTLSLLNAEPEAPKLEGTLDLKVYQWDYELDLSEYDDIAEICRNMEFVAFLIGLMLLTKKLIWG